MDFASKTVLITGAGTGIGYALAERFVRSGSTVIICGRRESKLKEAQDRYPQLHFRVCDLVSPAEREALFVWASEAFPDLDVLINNAGIQKAIRLSEQPSWETLKEEITINLEAPLHLSTLFIPHLLKQDRPAIINVTSALAFVPRTAVPVYCATKAAMRSFTLSLRHQLADTPISVIEMIPPAVGTDLGGGHLRAIGVPVQEFADAAAAQLKNGSIEVTYGFSSESSRATPDQLKEIFNRLNPSKTAPAS